MEPTNIIIKVEIPKGPKAKKINKSSIKTKHVHKPVVLKFKKSRKKEQRKKSIKKVKKVTKHGFGIGGFNIGTIKDYLPFGSKKKEKIRLVNRPYLNESHISMGETYPNENPNFKTALLIIDPQNDFVSNKESINDMINIITMLKTHGSKISDIFISLDMHNRFHIGNPLFWIDNKGRHPKPGTIIEHISSEWDFNDANWKTTRSEFQTDSFIYIQNLKKNKRHDLEIFGEHCLIGTKGSQVYGPLEEELAKWEKKYIKSVRYITKGSDSKTDQFSAIKPEYSVDLGEEGSENSEVNVQFIKDLEDNYNQVLVCGEVLSHCVRFTMQDLLNNSTTLKLVFLKDASTVLLPGRSSEFLGQMTQDDRFSISTTTEIFDNMLWNALIDKVDIKELEAKIKKFRNVQFKKENSDNSNNGNKKKESNLEILDNYGTILYDRNNFPINPYINTYSKVYVGKGPFPHWGPNFMIHLIIRRPSYNKDEYEYLAYFNKSTDMQLPSFQIDVDVEKENAEEQEGLAGLSKNKGTSLYVSLVNKYLKQLFPNINTNGFSSSLIYAGPYDTDISTTNSWIETSVYVVDVTESIYFQTELVPKGFYWTKELLIPSNISELL